MDDKRKKDLLDIVAHFRGKPVTGDVITEYCNLKGYDPISEGELEDFTYSVTLHQRANDMLPKLFAVLAEWKFLGELASDDAQKAQYHAIEAELLQVLEGADLTVQDVRWITRELSSIMGIMVKNVASNLDEKIVAVQNQWTKEKFGKGNILEVPASVWAKECAQLAGRS